LRDVLAATTTLVRTFQTAFDEALEHRTDRQPTGSRRPDEGRRLDDRRHLLQRVVDTEIIDSKQQVDLVLAVLHGLVTVLLTSTGQPHTGLRDHERLGERRRTASVGALGHRHPVHLAPDAQHVVKRLRRGELGLASTTPW